MRYDSSTSRTTPNADKNLKQSTLEYLRVGTHGTLHIFFVKYRFWEIGEYKSPPTSHGKWTVNGHNLFFFFLNTFG